MGYGWTWLDMIGYNSGDNSIWFDPLSLSPEIIMKRWASLNLPHCNLKSPSLHKLGVWGKRRAHCKTNPWCRCRSHHSPQRSMSARWCARSAQCSNQRTPPGKAMRHGKVMPYEISDQLLFYLFRDYIYIIYIWVKGTNQLWSDFCSRFQIQIGPCAVIVENSNDRSYLLQLGQ